MADRGTFKYDLRIERSTVCAFIKSHITAQPGPVLQDLLPHSAFHCGSRQNRHVCAIGLAPSLSGYVILYRESADNGPVGIKVNLHAATTTKNKTRALLV